jgi:4-hydroxy-3-methylbut-2-enyl diphosphate reductase
MKITRAAHFGMCFGVRDAITLALDQARQEPLTILGELVHNETVLRQLRERGIQIAKRPAEVQTPVAMVTAHGTSQKTLREARRHGLMLWEATCPLVRLAHRAVERLVREGYHPVIVGKRDHVEVRGITDDLEAFDVVLTGEDVERLAERPRFGVAAQTTQPIERVRHFANLIRGRFPRSEVRLVDTVCQPTKQRQHAAIELAQECDVVVVIGGVNSNNTRELVEACGRYCARVFHVQTEDDLRAEWFCAEDRVGLTAGTSTPDASVDAVEERLRAWHPVAACAEPLPVKALD